MIATGHDIQNEVYSLIRSSSLPSKVSGGVYKEGYRPKDSRLEDIVVIFTTSTGDQIQEGVVTINIYVPDVDPYANGVWVEDGARTSTLERELLTWLDGIDRRDTPYLFQVQQPPFTMADEPIRQHFVILRLRFRHLAT